MYSPPKPGLFDIRRVTILVFHNNFLLPINVVLTTFSYRYKASLQQGRATTIPETLLYSACDLTTNECISITNAMSAGAQNWLAHRVSIIIEGGGGVMLKPNCWVPLTV